MAEPYFGTSLLPWHSLFFWYCRTALASLLQPGAAILPRSATLQMVAVEFKVPDSFSVNQDKTHQFPPFVHVQLFRKLNLSLEMHIYISNILNSRFFVCLF